MKKYWILALMLVVVGCTKTQNYEVKNLTLKSSVPLLSILSIANSNEEVKIFLQNRTFSVEVKEVSQDEMAALPNVYAGLNGDLYMVYYSTDEFDLIVVTDEIKVLRIVPLQKMRI